MKYLLSLSLIFLFFNLSAQSKWSIGVVGGIDVSSIQIEKDFILTDQNGQVIEDRNEPSMQVRYGFNVNYIISPKFIIKSGLRINAQGTQSSIEATDLRWGNQHNGQGGFDPTIDPGISVGFETIYSKHRDKFIEVPLHIAYTKGNGQWKWFVEGGVSPNIYLTSTSIVKLDEGKPSRESRRFDYPGQRKLTGSVDLGFGVERMLTDQLSLSLQPMLRYYPLRISESELYLFKAHYYNFGMEVGVSYALDE